MKVGFLRTKALTLLLKGDSVGRLQIYLGNFYLNTFIDIKQIKMISVKLPPRAALQPFDKNVQHFLDQILRTLLDISSNFILLLRNRLGLVREKLQVTPKEIIQWWGQMTLLTNIDHRNED